MGHLLARSKGLMLPSLKEDAFKATVSETRGACSGTPIAYARMMLGTRVAYDARYSRSVSVEYFHSVWCWALSGIVWYSRTVCCYAMCGTAMAYGAMRCPVLLRVRYAMCGTAMAYGAIPYAATRYVRMLLPGHGSTPTFKVNRGTGRLLRHVRHSHSVCCYGCYAMCGTELAYGATVVAEKRPFEKTVFRQIMKQVRPRP
eukprot:1708814-Rhodomonas_salina.1